jgi:hypothetical protein
MQKMQQIRVGDEVRYNKPNTKNLVEYRVKEIKGPGTFIAQNQSGQQLKGTRALNRIVEKWMWNPKTRQEGYMPLAKSQAPTSQPTEQLTPQPATASVIFNLKRYSSRK